MKIVIVGASFSGVSCAVEARKNFPNDEIVLIDKQPDIGYIPSGLKLVLKGGYSFFRRCLFYKSKGIRTNRNYFMLRYLCHRVSIS